MGKHDLMEMIKMVNEESFEMKIRRLPHTALREVIISFVQDGFSDEWIIETIVGSLAFVRSEDGGL